MTRLLTCPECGAELALPEELRQAWERAWEACSLEMAERYFGVRLMRNSLRGQIHASHILNPEEGWLDA